MTEVWDGENFIEVDCGGWYHCGDECCGPCPTCGG